MAVIRHYRTALLQAAPTRFNLPPRDVLVAASGYLFKLDTAGNPEPASIAFAVALIGMEGDVTWEASAGLTLTGTTGSAATLTYANMTAATGTVKATITVDGQLYESLPVTINKVTDGAAGTSVHVATIYQQAASAPTAPTGGAFNFSNSTLTPPAGWSATQPASSTTPTYAAKFTFSTGTPGATVTAGAWSAPAVAAQNGSNGANSATVAIYKRTASAPAPALPTAATTYTFATGALTGLDNGWSATIPATGGGYLHTSVALATGAGATDTIAAAEWAAVRLLAQDGANGAQGNSARRAYSKSTLASLAGTPATITTTGSASFPPNDSWGVGTVWGASVHTLAAGEFDYITDGVYDPVANQTVWGLPFQAALKVGSLGAITVYTGGLEVSEYLRGGQTAYDTGTGFWLGLVAGTPKFSIGTAGGAAMVWDGAELVLRNPTINSGFTASASSTVGGNYANGTTSFGSITISASGGKAPYSYSMTITHIDGAGSGFTLSSFTSNSASVTCSVGASNQSATLAFAIVVTDANGQTKTLNLQKVISWGTGA